MIQWHNSNTCFIRTSDHYTLIALCLILVITMYRCPQSKTMTCAAAQSIVLIGNKYVHLLNWRMTCIIIIHCICLKCCSRVCRADSALCCVRCHHHCHGLLLTCCKPAIPSYKSAKEDTSSYPALSPCGGGVLTGREASQATLIVSWSDTCEHKSGQEELKKRHHLEQENIYLHKSSILFGTKNW